MKIELEDKDIDRIAKAVAKSVGGKPKAAAPKEEAEGEEAEGEEAEFEGEAEGEAEGDAEGAPDADDVLEAMKAVSKKFGQDKAMEILKSAGGAAKLSALKESKYAAVIAACKKAKK